MNSVCVAALYRFVRLDDHESLRAPVLATIKSLELRGTLLLAPEGINGTLAGDEAAVDMFLDWLRSDPLFAGRLTDLDAKKSYTDALPFARSKVKIKKEIVTMGVPGIDPEHSAGTYVSSADWNSLISDPDVQLIDTRNDYEVQIGTFKGAINPHTTTFREFPGYAKRTLDPAAHKKVAMFCTGGIRCEKSTAYLKSLGFDEVYHLQGGILKYLEEQDPADSLWEGECFVFDDRVTVDHNLAPGSYTQCYACRMPLSNEELESEHYVPGESCPHCFDKASDSQRQRYRERQKQMALASARGETHIGDNMDDLRQRRQARKLKDKEQQRAKS